MKQYTDYTPNIPAAEERLDDTVISLDPHQTRKNSGKGNTQERKSTSKKKKKVQEPASVKEIPAIFKASTYRNWAKNTTVRLITGVVLACMGVYFTIAFISYVTTCVADQSTIMNTAVGASGRVSNAGGEGGARIAQFLINDTFGLGSIVILFWMFAMSFKMFDARLRFKTVNFTIKCMVALIAVSLIVGLLTIGLDTPVNWGGLHGRYVNEFLIDFLGWIGAALVCILVIAIFVILCLRDIILWVIRLRKAAAKRRAEAAARKAADEERRRRIAELEAKEKEEALQAGESAPHEEETADDTAVRFQGDEVAEIHDLPGLDDCVYPEITDDDEPSAPPVAAEEDNSEPEAAPEGIPEETPAVEGDEPMVVHKNHILEEDADAPDVDPLHETKYLYKFPPYDLLEERGGAVSVDPEEQLENKERIKSTLANFGIGIRKIEATVGPTVTLYEIVPESGVKIAKIRSLVDDIALSLSAIGVRIIAPIPGKGTVGIEVANKTPQTVSMRSVIKSQAFRQTSYKLPIALGSTIGGDVFIADLSKMPHLLVAGATGQGKSVGLNAIITSLLYCRRPDELKFVMVDPKMVEFSLYAKIEKHYLAKLPDEEEPIITDVTRVAATLSSLCVEMDDRYMLLKAAGVRNIEEYNRKFHNHQLNPQKGHKFLPYIVIIVDEFSDLIMQAGKEVEMPIARLAQKARAVGMHVIIATQRPSTNVITGIIKGNFPARIAFKVSSGIDSKTILDTTGAQQLIGRGDMLISNSSDMQRVQCAFVDTPEVEAICEYVAAQPHARGPYILPEPRIGETEDIPGGVHGGPDRDPLFEEIARLVVNSNSASTSSLQRRYSIGYNRAGKIMDQLESYGIVGPAQGGKPRSVLMDATTLESLLATF